jgi:hypothetical protein
MNPPYPFDASLHSPDSVAAEGLCSQHGRDSAERGTCLGEAIVSFKDRHDRWQSGCALALEQLVERREITPPGQGA